MPQRWSIAHLYQAVLNNEEHLPKLDYITTLSGYIHWKLTGERVLGIGDASGMFPIDSTSMDYDRAMEDKFDALIMDKASVGSYVMCYREYCAQVNGQVF